jgi:hypothetical protein
MALPSASLGTLPSMSMPFHLPVNEVRKEPKAWEKILLGMLGAGTSALVGQAVSNLMSQDKAAEFGQTPKTGFSKILQGPQVSEQEAHRLRQDKLERDKMASGERRDRMNTDLKKTEMNQNATRNFRAAEIDMERIMAGIQGANLDREVEVENLRNQAAARKLEGLITELNSRRQGKVADAQVENLGAETELRRVQAANEADPTLRLRKLRQLSQEPDTTHGKVIVPEDELTTLGQISQGMGQQVQATSGNVDPIKDLLMSGVSEEEIVRQLDPNALTPRQQQVQNIAASRAAQEEAAAAELERKVNQIRLRLMGNLPGVLPGTLPGEYGGL